MGFFWTPDGRLSELILQLSGWCREFARFHNLQHNWLLEVVHVERVSPAEVGGVFKGHFITELNGDRIITADDIHHALSEWTAGNKMY